MANRPHNKTQDVWDAFLAGTPPIQIAEGLGLARQTVYNLITKGRKHGVIPGSIKKNTRELRLKRSHIKVGAMRSVTCALSDEQLDWVIDQCIGMRMDSIAEYALELIRDAHAEAISKQRTEDR